VVFGCVLQRNILLYFGWYWVVLGGTGWSRPLVAQLSMAKSVLLARFLSVNHGNETHTNKQNNPAGPIGFPMGPTHWQVLGGVEWYRVVLNGIVSYWVVLSGIGWY
jgi:hypothetical protein